MTVTHSSPPTIAPETAIHKRHITRWAPLLLTLGLTALGLALRLYHLTHLSYWLDEGSSVRLARQPLSVLLGTGEIYDTHPPLYYVLLHFLRQALQNDEWAGRLIPAVFGALTVPIVLAIGRELDGVAAGAIAAFLVAITPLQVWYAQDARPYGQVIYLVCLSYLALLKVSASRARGWWVVYALATATAIYTDYSAFLALSGQVFLLPRLLRDRGTRRPLGVALLVILLLYLPWLRTLLETFHLVTEQGILPDSAPITLHNVWLTLIDFAALDSSYFYGAELPWLHWPVAFWGTLVVLGAGALLGVLALWRQPWWATMMVWITAAPPLLLLALSQREPMYYTRTLLFSQIGLLLLLAVGLVWLTRRHPRLFVVTMVMLSVVTWTNLVTLDLMYRHANKQMWRALASDLRVGLRANSVVVYYPGVARDLVEMYFDPAQAGAATFAFEGPTAEQVAVALGPAIGGERPVWLAYQKHPGLDTVQGWLSRQGYSPVVTREYWHPLGLQLYARGSATGSSNLLLNSDFKEHKDGLALHWMGEARVDDGGIVQDRQPGANNAPPNDVSQIVKVKPRTYYYLSLEYKNDLRAGAQRIYGVLQDNTGKWLDIQPSGAGLELQPSREWTKARLGFVTSAESSQLQIILRNDGQGKTWVRNVRLEQQ